MIEANQFVSLITYSCTDNLAYITEQPACHIVMSHFPHCSIFSIVMPSRVVLNSITQLQQDAIMVQLPYQQTKIKRYRHLNPI
jgi:hypothetical protein